VRTVDHHGDTRRPRSKCHSLDRLFLGVISTVFWRHFLDVVFQDTAVATSSRPFSNRGEDQGSWVTDREMIL